MAYKFYNGAPVMCFEFKYHRPRNTAIITELLVGCLLMLQLLTAPAATAVEVLSARELASHCAQLGSEPDGVDGQYCMRYIQGILDAAVATDARIMLNAESALERGEAFAEPAMRTRVPSLMGRSRASNLAGFWLGDPLLWRDAVDVFLAELAVLPDDLEIDEPAMKAAHTFLINMTTLNHEPTGRQSYA